MAKVFVSGATGVAGRASVAALIRDGHTVTAAARTEEKASMLRDLGARPVHADLFDRAAARAAIRGHDAVVNLATKIPAPEKALLPGAWKENDRIRRDLSKNLVDACIDCGVPRYIQESLGFVYRDSGDDWIDEETPLDVPPHATTILDAEAQVARFARTGTGVVLRFGQFYASNTPHTQTMIATARKGISPFFGPEDGFVAMIHADDVGSAVVAAIDAPGAIYNVVDDEPMRRRELDEVLSRALDLARLRSIPAPLARAGGSKVRMLMRSQLVSNRRLRATGWRPAVRDARAGLRRVVAEMGRVDA